MADITVTTLNREKFPSCSASVIFRIKKIKIANKNAFFTDAMKYAAPYMRGIFVSSDEHKLAVEELLGKDFEVQLFDGTEELRNIVNAAIGK